ncbi:MAG TPA: hypothetical protein VG370_30150 [Chloroflexota bacterium]|nr:hypothetical protein [Chloroflexota bacterium]
MIISLTSADPVADEDREPVFVTLRPQELARILRALATARRAERRAAARPEPAPPTIPSWQA